MNVCNWDWGAIGSIAGAIATFTGAGVALYISRQWREQKASEIIAKDSKDLIENIIKNISTLGEIIYKDTSSIIRNENVINSFLICKKLDLEIHSKIYSIDNLIIIDNLDNLDNLYKSFNDQNLSILDNLEFRIEKDDFKEYERYRPLLIEKHKALTKIGEEIMNKLSLYSIHQENLKLKKTA
jgi:hypothetical protein